MDYDQLQKQPAAIDPIERLLPGRSSGRRLSLDPSDNIQFDDLSGRDVLRFDHRDNKALQEAAHNEPTALERERAIWEYTDRLGREAIPFVWKLLRIEEEQSVRRGLLWLIQKHASQSDIEFIRNCVNDPNPDTADWSRMLFRESTGKECDPTERDILVDPQNVFDQTLPLVISGKALFLSKDVGSFLVTLSPLWFEQVMGRVMACTRKDTFATTLTIEKRLKHYHPDQSDHFEIYSFHGLTTAPSLGITEHIYESQSAHRFYLSGKVEDKSEGFVDDVNVVLARKANPIIVKPRQELFVSNDGRSVPAGSVVQSVRGKYYGFAYANPRRILANGLNIGPGEVQLSSPTHPIAGPLTNIFLYGTFKGMLSDLNKDGMLDLNTEPCHSTIEGELDYQLLGHCSPDPFA